MPAAVIAACGTSPSDPDTRSLAGSTAGPRTAPAIAPATPEAVRPDAARSALAAPVSALQPPPDRSTPAVPETASARAEPPIDPVALRGRSDNAVLALFGPADLVRRDGSAEVWIYRGTGCTVDLFLYRREEGLQVAHVAVREGRKPARVPEPCLQALAARGTGRTGG